MLCNSGRTKRLLLFSLSLSLSVRTAGGSKGDNPTRSQVGRIPKMHKYQNFPRLRRARCPRGDPRRARRRRGTFLYLCIFQHAHTCPGGLLCAARCCHYTVHLHLAARNSVPSTSCSQCTEHMLPFCALPFSYFYIIHHARTCLD